MLHLFETSITKSMATARGALCHCVLSMYNVKEAPIKCLPTRLPASPEAPYPCCCFANGPLPPVGPGDDVRALPFGLSSPGASEIVPICAAFKKIIESGVTRAVFKSARRSSGFRTAVR